MNSIKKILIAEDEILVAKVMKMIFERKGFTVMHVLDAADAERAAKEFSPDLIVLDIYLRNKSCGIEAGKRIRQNGFKGPIFFTTGNSFIETSEQIREIGNTTLFTKPVDPDALMKFIELNF